MEADDTTYRFGNRCGNTIGGNKVRLSDQRERGTSSGAGGMVVNVRIGSEAHLKPAFEPELRIGDRRQIEACLRSSAYKTSRTVSLRVVLAEVA